MSFLGDVGMGIRAQRAYDFENEDRDWMRKQREMTAKQQGIQMRNAEMQQQRMQGDLDFDAGLRELVKRPDFNMRVYADYALQAGKPDIYLKALEAQKMLDDANMQEVADFLWKKDPVSAANAYKGNGRIERFYIDEKDDHVKAYLPGGQVQDWGPREYIRERMGGRKPEMTEWGHTEGGDLYQKETLPGQMPSVIRRPGGKAAQPIITKADGREVAFYPDTGLRIDMATGRPFEREGVTQDEQKAIADLARETRKFLKPEGLEASMDPEKARTIDNEISQRADMAERILAANKARYKNLTPARAWDWAERAMKAQIVEVTRDGKMMRVARGAAPGDADLVLEEEVGVTTAKPAAGGRGEGGGFNSEDAKRAAIEELRKSQGTDQWAKDASDFAELFYTEAEVERMKKDGSWQKVAEERAKKELGGGGTTFGGGRPVQKPAKPMVHGDVRKMEDPDAELKAQLLAEQRKRAAEGGSMPSRKEQELKSRIEKNVYEREAPMREKQKLIARRRAFIDKLQRDPDMRESLLRGHRDLSLFTQKEIEDLKAGRRVTP